MSLIWGQINLKNKTIDNGMFDALYEGIKHFPHERKQQVIEQNAAFGHALTYNTPEALHEQMPKFVAEQNLLFVAQGRIDNREELGKLLSIEITPTLPDGDLMLAAYLHWGQDTPTHLLGDWSFAAYHFDNQTLLLARDHIGYTALFYYFDGETFYFSSSQKSILSLPNFKKELNEELFLGHLLLVKDEKTFDEQIYKGIFLVSPAHTLTFNNGKITTQRYWFPEKIKPQRGKTTQQYAAELNKIFTEAVRCRLRSHKPVASMLSGGLDSGSVATVAAEIYRAEGKRLTTFSHVPLFKEKMAEEQPTLKSGWLLDETDNIMATAQKATNIDPVFLDSAQLTPTQGAKKAIEVYEGLFHAICNAYWLVDLPTEVQKHGFGTLLSGEMGNAGISYTGEHYLLPFLHPFFLKNPKQFLRKRIAKSLLLKYFSGWYYGKKNLLAYIKDSYVKQAVIDKWNIVEEAKKADFIRYYHTAAEGMLHILMVGSNPRCMFGANKSHYYGFELRDPTGDVRVIEYLLSLPNEAFISLDGEQKHILKLMMKNRLPDSVLFCKKKGLQSADVLHRIRAEADTITKMIDALKQDKRVNTYFDFERMQQKWQDFQNTESYNVLGVQTIIKNLIFAQFMADNSAD